MSKRALLVVFDGLRPDCITEAAMPNLAAFASRSTRYSEARSVFPSMTRVATTSIATGAPPSVHGIVGNSFYYPAATRAHAIDMARADDIALAEAASEGRLIACETFGDVLAKAGKNLCAVHLGSAGSAYCINPRARAHGHWTFSIHGEDHSQTPEAVRDSIARCGPLPPRTLPRHAETDYGARVLCEQVLDTMDPDMALIWFNEPDTAFHYCEIGSPRSMAALESVDAAFGRILARVSASPHAAETLVIAASDHGQIASHGLCDVAARMTEAGFRAIKAAERRVDGADFLVTGGNMGEIRSLRGDAEALEAVAQWLMRQDWIGMVFTRSDHPVEGAVPGTLSLKAVMLEHPRAPDLVYVLRSDCTMGPGGLAGRCLISGGVPVGGGMHGGLNRHELNTVLMVGRGDGGGEGVGDHRACGIIDIAPTLLAHFGLPAPHTMLGMDLCAAPPTAQEESISASADGFRQSLRLARRGGHLFPLHGEGGMIA